MTAKKIFIIALALFAIIAIVLLILLRRTSKTPTINDTAATFNNAGYYSLSEAKNSAIVVVKINKVLQRNNDVLIQVQTSSSAPQKTIALTQNGLVKFTYIVNKTNLIFSDNSSTITTIKNQKDLIDALNGLIGKNVALDFYLNSPINKGLFSESVLKCNTENLNKDSLLSAPCTPLSTSLSSYAQ